jgi:type IV pilus assembly protein PilM
LDLSRLFSGKKDIFGLDIGSTFVKAVQLQKDDNGRYKVIAVQRTKIISTTSNNRARTESIVRAIRHCVQKGRIKTKYAVCGVYGPNVAARRFRFPALLEEEISDAVLFEAEQVCPFESGHFIVDYQLINNKNSEKFNKTKKTTGVLVAATPDVIGRKSQLTRAASLNCVLMDINGLALLNCLIGCQNLKDSETTAVLDIGSQFASLAILHNNGLPVVRDIAYAANEIIDKIATENNLPAQEVRDFLVLSNPQNNTITDLTAPLEKACDKLIAEITETLRYYTIQEGNVVDKILVCGGFAKAKGLIELLNAQLPPQVTLWNPLSSLEHDPNARGIEIIDEHGPSLVVAAGLAMRTI